MPRTDWITTSREVFAVLWAKHHDDLVVFATHTCMDGCEFHDQRHIYTEWGFKDADFPLMRSERIGKDDAETCTFDLAIPHEDPTDATD